MKLAPIVVMVDAVITVAHEEIVLITRKNPPDMKKYALPGGHVEPLLDNSLKAACARETKEEINLIVPPNYWKLLTVLGKLNRDPRYGASLSVIFWYNVPYKGSLGNIAAGDDAASVFMKKIKELESGQMAFDHWEVIELLKNKFKIK